MNDLESKLRKDGQRLIRDIEVPRDLGQRIDALVMNTKQSPVKHSETTIPIGLRWAGWLTATSAVVALLLVVQTPQPVDNDGLSLPVVLNSLEPISDVENNLHQELELVETDIESFRQVIRNELEYLL